MFCFSIIYNFYIYNFCEVRSCQVIVENRPFNVYILAFKIVFISLTRQELILHENVK